MVPSMLQAEKLKREREREQIREINMHYPEKSKSQISNIEIIYKKS